MLVKRNGRPSVDADSEQRELTQVKAAIIHGRYTSLLTGRQHAGPGVESLHGIDARFELPDQIVNRRIGQDIDQTACLLYTSDAADEL